MIPLKRKISPALAKVSALLLTFACLAATCVGCAKSGRIASFDASDTEISEAFPGASDVADTYSSHDRDIAFSYSSSTSDAADDMYEIDSDEAEYKSESSASARKIIYTSYFNIQTTSFDETTAALDRLCDRYGAYYEQAETYGYAEKGNRNGAFTVRVPSEHYNAFRQAAGELGTVVRSSENNQDVSEKYYDTEARLASAKLREERLLDILSKAESLDNVLLLESELSEVRYEIESLSGTLRKYDSLVDYSTVTVDIAEVSKPVTVQTLPKTFGERMAQAASGGFRSFSDSLQDLVIELTYNLPSLILLVIFIVIVWIVIHSVRKKNKKKKSAGGSPAPTNDTTN